MTQVVPDLDQATRDELQPPCDAPRNDQPCPEPAAWVAWLTGAVTTPHTLLCDDHAEASRRHNAACPQCRAWGIVLHLEPLDRRPE